MTGSLQIRNGIYQCVLNFKDERGKRKQKWISTKLEEKGNKKRAVRILNELLSKYSDKDFQCIKNLKFIDYLVKWLESKRGNVENNTFLEYQGLIPDIKDLFINLRIQQDKNKILFGTEYEKSDYIFTWQNGKLLRPDYITKAFQKNLKKKTYQICASMI